MFAICAILITGIKIKTMGNKNIYREIVRLIPKKIKSYWLKVKSFWFINKNIRFKLITYNKIGSDWTLYKKILKEFAINHKLRAEIMKTYGQSFCNVVEYEKSGVSEDGHTIWSVKRKSES